MTAYAKAAWARARRARVRAGVVGDMDHVPVRLVQKAVRDALEAGTSVTLLAQLAGVSRGTVTAVAHRSEDGYLLEGTRRALVIGLARAEARKRNGERTPRRVDASGPRTKLRRLAAAGWPVKRMLVERRISENVFRDRAKYVSPETAAAVDALYDEIGGRLGPDVPNARKWRARGYVIPAAESAEDMLPLPPTARQAKGRAARLRRRRALRALRQSA